MNFTNSGDSAQVDEGISVTLVGSVTRPQLQLRSPLPPRSAMPCVNAQVFWPVLTRTQARGIGGPPAPGTTQGGALSLCVKRVIALERSRNGTSP